MEAVSHLRHDRSADRLVTDGANRHHVRMLEPTLDDMNTVGYFADIGCRHLDRGNSSGAVGLARESGGDW